MTAESKANKFMEQGEKALKKTSFFSFGSSSQRNEEASDLFEKAGNQYKIAKNWQKAAEAYEKCARCQVSAPFLVLNCIHKDYSRMKESSRAAQFYQHAAEALAKVNPMGEEFRGSSKSTDDSSHLIVFCAATDAMMHYKTAISMLCDAGRFSTAAKLQKQVAEIYEKQDNKEEALEAYRSAGDYFAGENQSSSANNMMLKVAQLSAELEKFDAALEIYESIAKSSMESNLLKFNAKSHLLNAGICALATKDMVLVQMKWEEFQDIDYTFADSREGKFLRQMMESYEAFNADAFADAVFQFDSISKIEPWKISLLLRIKENIMGEVDATQDLT
ncbi:hypothetical protein PsorP6_019300 [Peronosclerospora sorghi]|nr:hypothetical protein PsorP6_019300 [Peronosclerospora sorghi]